MEYLPDLIFHPLVILLALLILVVLIYCVGVYNYRVLHGMNIPGAKPFPYIGNLRDFAKYGGMHFCILEYMKKYGKVFSLCAGRKASIVIADPELLKQIMVKDFDYFTDRFFVLRDNNRCLEQLHGGDWRRMRSILTPTFTTGKLKKMVPAIEESCRTLVDKFEGIAETGKSVNMFSWFGLMSLEVILSTAFGIKSPVQTEKLYNKFLIKAQEIIKSPTMIRVLLMLPLSKMWIRSMLAFGGQKEYLKSAAQGILKSRKGEKEKIQRAQDLVDIMLSAKNADGSSALDDDDITAQAILFLLAGYETSSTTLTMISYHLALNPDIQERLRCEILIALQTNPDKPLYDLVQELEYLDCVINEVLRLSPPTHMVNRLCSKPYKISDDTTIPAGMEVIIPIYSLHHDPEAWPEPEKFDPERFRGPAKESRHPFQFMPFGEGPRNCIGKRFGLLEAKITLVNLLTKYKFVRSSETQVPLKQIAGRTLIPEDGVFVGVESHNH